MCERKGSVAIVQPCSSNCAAWHKPAAWDKVPCRKGVFVASWQAEAVAAQLERCTAEHADEVASVRSEFSSKVQEMAVQISILQVGGAFEPLWPHVTIGGDD
jgi:hypothetical protein